MSELLTTETLTHGEREYRALEPADLDKIAEEIGEHFGHSSIHSIAFDGLRVGGRRSAAAPELLEALKNVVGFCATGCQEAEMAMDDARAAIAKAEGRS